MILELFVGPVFSSIHEQAFLVVLGWARAYRDFGWGSVILYLAS